MNRTRDYYRKQRKRAIRRKSGILRRIGGEQYVHAWAQGSTGRFAKGKIHCSCWMCRTKSYDEASIRDKRLSLTFEDRLRENE